VKLHRKVCTHSPGGEGGRSLPTTLVKKKYGKRTRKGLIVEEKNEESRDKGKIEADRVK
jgi:hypothetical protein